MATEVFNVLYELDSNGEIIRTVNFDVGTAFDTPLSVGETFTIPDWSVTFTYVGTNENGDIVGTLDGTNYLFTDTSYGDGGAYPEITGTDFVCFLAGTLIATEYGEVPVETLRAGDLVLARHGGQVSFKPLVWVGRMEAGAASGASGAPIIIEAGALGQGMPVRDLGVSPEHALLVDGVLIPAHLLVNGETIRREPTRRRVTYYHLELERHGLLLSDGAWSESYREAGNRHLFDNAGVTVMASGALSPPGQAGVACLPILRDGPRLAGIHRRLAALSQRRQAA
ncbi:Hint domain-containing protein [Neoroseomonas lacus]|uniref:Hedgehog/Intein (Hint) domain-containing protein n=1 Tax=Neoroseomonas lacus TaxID=287609 RepID=A0A917L0L2_9PROT|nr:Hint domain-containing protein [Neoroseomonas lacus]GGJ39221.1 hypothetical protein GCM10011320_53560 [Neoroseomonas lacus]